MQMFHWVYGFWLLVPIIFLSLGLWAVWKKFAKIPGREYAADYFKQGFYCTVGLILAVVADKTIFEVMIGSLGLSDGQANIFRFLLYPGVLLAMVSAHRLYKGDETRNRIKHRQQSNSLANR